MQDHDGRKTKLFDLGLQNARQQEAAALVEASDDEATLNVRVGDFSPLQFFPRPQGGLL